MQDTQRRRVLIVAYRTAATPTLIEHVRRRAAAGPCAFTLLVPQLHRVVDPEADEPEKILELAIPLLDEAAGDHVEGVIGDSDPYVAVRELLKQRDVDEIVVSTLPQRVSRWLRRDLPRQLREFGKPVTVVTAPQAQRPVYSPPHGWGA
jgi:hypothetical protein